MKGIFLLTIGLLFQNNLHSQISATTTDGKKVTLKVDGTWEYDMQNPVSNSVPPDCSSLVVETVDKFTGQKSFSHNDFIRLTASEDGLNAIMIYWEDRKYGVLVFYLPGYVCIEEENAVNIIFTDGTKKALVSNSEFNCDGETKFYFGDIFGRSKDLELFKTKSIEAIRITSSKSYHDIDFTSEGRELFKVMVNCIFKSI